MKSLLLVFVAFFSVAAQAEILFQDPTGKELNAAIAQLSEDDVKEISDSGSGKDNFFLGLFYINGAPEFGIKKDCQKAVSFLNAALEEDVSDAAYTLSTMYYNGVCTDRDIGKSRELAVRSAQGGYMLAQRMLGMSYLGEKWQRLYSYNVKKGVFWLGEAGNAGDRKSSAHLAGMYYKGDGVPKDDAKYFEWLKKAVFSKYDEGNRLGFMAMAKCYENGKGTEVNLVEAYKYYDLSGTAGVEGKRRVAKKMSQDQIDEAIRQSQEWQKENNVQVGGGFIRRAN
ncbi:sel1 repeat family protein [Salinicola endophyticus]|uniref:Sel1 repeat family protein n=1 Tax=Salinicola endophyticus TaxID=1949083 RepID=A0ABY8FRF8_9GAMM|nr:tetratricopeptide repeat protein [Salinicola endophyticus]WFF43376.1 sel1 repeat family protein [Salinicola endophyticus]